MKINLIILATTALTLLISSNAITGQATESSRYIAEDKKIAVKPLGWYQDCYKFEPSETIKVEFSSLKPVKFSSNYRKRRTMESIVVWDEPPTESYKNSIKVQAGEVYCFMWHNKNLEYTTVIYDISVEDK